MSRPAGGLGSPMMLVAKGYRLVQRDLQFLMPESMRDWLPASDPVWLVINVVAGLDTWGVHARRRTRGAGRAGYDPDMFLTLLIWTWAHGVRPSRVIERMCQRELAFRIICGGDWPDHVTIARFRAGAQLLPECRAVRLDADRTQVRHVICEHRSGMLALKAKVVVLAAGALVTPVLLLNEPSRRCSETGCVESPCFWWGASVIVVELFDGLGGEVVEVLVRAFGVEPLHPFGGAQLDVVDVAPGALAGG